jgi:hypothetical protein
MTDFDATAFAADVPVYVRATADGYELVDTQTDGVLSTHAKLREALDAALDAGITTKTPILRDDAGEPNGQWRWFSAAGEESEVNKDDGMRMSRANVWQFASGLNTRRQPIPIDGGPQPAGMRPSEVHGTAADSATPANGWAHAGVIYDDGASHSVVFRGEILPEITPEVDRGRLAFGSVHFTHTKLDNNGEAELVVLHSFALTNRPVDTQVLAASTMRSAVRSHLLPAMFVGTRTRKAQIMSADTEKSRGAAMEALKTLAGMVGVAIEDEMNEESWCSPTLDKISRIINAAKDEAAIESVTGGGEIQQAETPPEKPEEPVEERSRAVEGLEGEALDAFAASVIALMREVLGKPDATPEELLTEFGARKEALAAAMGVAASPNPSGTPAEDNAMAEENKNDGGDAERARAKDQTQLIAERARAKKLEQDLETANAKLRAIENEKRLDEELKKRGLTLSDEDRQTMLRSAEKFGWDFVAVSLRSHHTPPTGEVMRSKPAEETVRRARSLKDAVAAEEKAVFEDAKLRGQPPPSDAKAHRLAIKRLRAKSPELFVQETATR